MSDVISLKDRKKKVEEVKADLEELTETDFEKIEANNRKRKERVEKERIALNNRLKNELKLTKKKK
jgi:hypothetical protein